MYIKNVLTCGKVSYENRALRKSGAIQTDVERQLRGRRLG